MTDAEMKLGQDENGMYMDPYKQMTTWSMDVVGVQEIILWIQVCSPLFYIIGMPLYAFTGYINAWINYVWVWICFIATLDAQGIIAEPIILETMPTEADVEKYSFLNYILFPYRKLVVAGWLTAVGVYGGVIPFVWWIPTVIFGALQIVNSILF